MVSISDGESGLSVRTKLNNMLENGATKGGPVVILFDGQSNIQNRRTYSWNPPENLFVWNNTGDATGSAFIACPTNQNGFAFAWAAEYARQHPAQDVYCISSGNAGQDILNWLDPTPGGEEDCYTITKNRVEAALAQIDGKDEIDLLVWWQGESDSADRTDYPTRFESLVTRWQAEDWFPENCPIRICGLVSQAVNGSANYRRMNIVLQKLAWEPTRSFFQTHEYLEGAAGGSDWLDTLHPTGLGYDKAGIANARDYMHPTGRYRDGIVFDPETVFYGFGEESEAGVDWDFRRDQDEDVTRRIVNLDGGDNARAVDVIMSSGGIFQSRAWGALATGRFEQTWSGTAIWQLKAASATGGFAFFGGQSTETARLNADIFRLTLGSEPGDDNLGTVAEFYVTETDIVGKVPVEFTDKFVLSGPTVPASASATGTAGEVAWDADYVYVCVATDTWKRAALSTW